MSNNIEMKRQPYYEYNNDYYHENNEVYHQVPTYNQTQKHQKYVERIPKTGSSHRGKIISVVDDERIKRRPQMIQQYTRNTYRPYQPKNKPHNKYKYMDR